MSAALRDKFRYMTAPLRALPNVIVIGGQRCGTTSLFEFMCQHPQVHSPVCKEVHYFDIFFDKGARWYRSRFPLRAAVPSHDVVAEASPYYLFHPRAPERLAEVLPDAHLIVLLRNPVERALSQYFLEVRLERESLPIADALDAEDERLAPETERMDADPFYYSRIHQWYSYARRGMYITKLKHYDAYRRAGRLCVLSSEEFFARPHDTMEKVFSAIGVDPSVRCRDVAPRNVGSNKTKVPDDVYNRLRALYKPYNEQLFDYLGRRFTW